jgi:hypothetical protein
MYCKKSVFILCIILFILFCLKIHDKLYDESLQTFLRKTFLLGVSNLHREILLI